MTAPEVTGIYNTGLQKIYGSDIVVTSDSPDGQQVGIVTQFVIDNADILVQINNGFDPDLATGVILDQRVAINGIQRQAATFTTTDVTVVTSTSINLYGLDQTVNQVYTLSDTAGNLWQLQNTQLGVSPGTNVFSFQAATAGAIASSPNTITIQITVVLGVVSVNNPNPFTTLGVNQESDVALKIRRARSVAQGSQGYLSALYAALGNINGVTSEFVYENETSITDSDGVPGHCIWVIVAGSGSASDIANAIYTKRNAGCNMFGEQSFTIIQINGLPFVVNWDNVETVNLFIKFTATSINGTTAPGIPQIVSGLPNNYVPGVFEEVNINALATQVQIIDPNTLVTNAGFSTGQTQIFNFTGTAASGSFILNYGSTQSAAINWNDPTTGVTSIQSKLQAMAGLGSATVTGTIAGGTLTFNLLAIDSVSNFLYASSNTLQTSAPAAVTISYTESYSNILSPSSKKFQFVISSGNIIIVPILISPSTASVEPSGTLTFTANGGYQTYKWSLLTNNSGTGAAINASTGVYTAGSTGPFPCTDTIQVTDVLGNTQTRGITVL